MVLAIAVDGDQVASHFGRCESYMLADIADGELRRCWSVDNPGHEPGKLPGYLAGLGVTCVISGGMGSRASQMFAGRGIQVMVGYTGTVERAIELYRTEQLMPGDNECDHDDAGSCR